MPYTVRLCRDASGWFATMQEPPPGLTRAQVTVASRALAFQLVAVGQEVARNLDRKEDALRVARAIARPPLFG